MAGLKKKLTITKCTREKNGNTTVTSDKFEVMINPEGYTRKWNIDYSSEKTLGQMAEEKKFSKMGACSVNIKKAILDGTGVVQLGGPTVSERIEQLRKIVYNYDGDKHEPNRVRLLWGSLIFFGRLTSLSVDYTLFKPDGSPLRAEVSMDFEDSTSPQEAQLIANQSSPDLTHIVEVSAGDTLPLLCHRIYGDCAYYPEVAALNNIESILYLKPGIKLRFPPLV